MAAVFVLPPQKASPVEPELFEELVTGSDQFGSNQQKSRLLLIEGSIMNPENLIDLSPANFAGQIKIRIEGGVLRSPCRLVIPNTSAAKYEFVNTAVYFTEIQASGVIFEDTLLDSLQAIQNGIFRGILTTSSKLTCIGTTTINQYRGQLNCMGPTKIREFIGSKLEVGADVSIARFEYRRKNGTSRNLPGIVVNGGTVIIEHLDLSNWDPTVTNSSFLVGQPGSILIGSLSLPTENFDIIAALISNISENAIRTIPGRL